MKIVFMGTPEFAAPSLKALVNAGYQVQAVVTQPDRPKGRGKKLSPSPVKLAALDDNLTVLQPGSVKDPAFLRELERLSPDLIVVVAYGKILPKSILDLPRLGCVNVHASLLPRYRGAAPARPPDSPPDNPPDNPPVSGAGAPPPPPVAPNC